MTWVEAEDWGFSSAKCGMASSTDVSSASSALVAALLSFLATALDTAPATFASSGVTAFFWTFSISFFTLPAVSAVLGPDKMFFAFSAAFMIGPSGPTFGSSFARSSTALASIADAKAFTAFASSGLIFSTFFFNWSAIPPIFSSSLFSARFIDSFEAPTLIKFLIPIAFFIAVSMSLFVCSLLGGSHGKNSNNEVETDGSVFRVLLKHPPLRTGLYRRDDDGDMSFPSGTCNSTASAIACTMRNCCAGADFAPKTTAMSLVPPPFGTVAQPILS